MQAIRKSYSDQFLLDSTDLPSHLNFILIDISFVRSRARREATEDFKMIFKVIISLTFKYRQGLGQGKVGKSFLCKHEDLSLDNQKNHKKAVRTDASMLRQHGTGLSSRQGWGHRHTQARPPDSTAPVQSQSLLQELRWRTNGLHLGCLPASTHACTVRARINIYTVTKIKCIKLHLESENILATLEKLKIPGGHLQTRTFR